MCSLVGLPPVEASMRGTLPEMFPGGSTVIQQASSSSKARDLYLLAKPIPSLVHAAAGNLQLPVLSAHSASQAICAA